MEFLCSICRFLEKYMKFCIGWMLLAMSVLAFTGVVTRYFFFYSIIQPYFTASMNTD